MSNIIVFKDGNLEVATKVEQDSIWLTQKELCLLFDRDKSVISRHINNVFKSGELDKDSVVAKNATTASDGKTYQVEYYNLDLIISVGYRVNSKKATIFRQWATKVLKEYLLKGYVVNQNKIKENLQQFKKEIDFLTRVIQESDLKEIEAFGFLDIVTKYTKSWIVLNQYDEQSLSKPQGSEPKFILDYDDAVKAIKNLKDDLISKEEATSIFGVERENSLKGIIRNIYQTFGGDELMPTIEEKAANLFYYIVKDHPFIDGNKRVGAFLFILFLSKNSYLFDKNGELKINQNALVSLALLIATSNPSEKDMIIKLIMNLLCEDSYE